MEDQLLRGQLYIEANYGQRYLKILSMFEGKPKANMVKDI